MNSLTMMTRCRHSAICYPAFTPRRCPAAYTVINFLQPYRAWWCLGMGAIVCTDFLVPHDKRLYIMWVEMCNFGDTKNR